ncbi:formin-binding protein [Coemansia sp. RSA 486]|nr:formin-binding protein [Coemansia sp. RSA 486]
MLGKDQPPASASGHDTNDGLPTIASTVKSNGNVSVAETGVEIAADFVCSERFADNFWSTDERCISVLMHKLKSAKQTCADILQMITTRANVEEDMGKKLSKLSRSGLGSEEVGSIKDALRSVRTEMETNAKSHMELARQLRSEIEKPLGQFINDQRMKRRAQTMVIQKTEGERNTLRSQLRKLQDKRRSDTKKVGDLDLQVNGLQGVGDPKLKSKLDRAQMQQKATESEYIDVRARLKDADMQWYNVWKGACDVFQVLEEERIEYLKTCLWTYTNLVSGSCVADDESMERIRMDLEKVSVAEDIATFIHTFGTGAPDPELAGEAAQASASAAAATGENSQTNTAAASSSSSSHVHPIMTPAKTSASHHRPTTSMSGVSIGTPTSAIPAPDHGSYINNNHNTFNSVSTTGSGTARSGSILAHSTTMSRPQTQESIRQQQQQQQRPVSMHAAGAAGSGGPASVQQPMHVHQLFSGGSANWNSRPASSMQGPISADNTFRRASNNDMYGMVSGAPQQQQQQQFIQRTNSQMAMRPTNDVVSTANAYINNMYGTAAPMDPRAPSSIGMYRGTGTETPIPMGPPIQHRPGTPSQQPSSVPDMNAYGIPVGYVNQQQPPPPLMGSPRTRSSTFNGASGPGLPSQQHTGNFGTLTATTQMHPSPQQQQPFPNSAPSSPYQQAVGAGGGSRPMSSAGIHPVPVMHYGSVGIAPMQQSPQQQQQVNAAYRSATPVQQQHSPQYVTTNNTNVVNRPPTQMSHSPILRTMSQQQQQQQRAPSVMAGSYGASPQQPVQKRQPPSSGAAAGSNQVSETGKEILFYVKVLYDYDAENEKELSIKEGDVISVFAVSPDGWWEGELTDRRTGKSVQGTFPSNFTDPISH